MNKVYACIDGLTNSAAVIDGAAWAALRLDAPLELLHMLERDSGPASGRDYSGAIGLGAQESLLQELSELDEQRGKLAQEVGRRMLLAASAHATAAGITRVDTRLRHGDLIEGVTDMEPDARLFVLGEHHRAQGASKVHLDHHVERVIRSVKRPVLVLTGEHFATPKRLVIAFDGSDTARKVVATVAASRLLTGLAAQIVVVGSDAQRHEQQLTSGLAALTAAGFQATTALLPGEPEEVIPSLLRKHGDALLVMGAYGHSRIRQFIVGSTTTTLLRLCDSPVLVMR